MPANEAAAHDWPALVDGSRRCSASGARTRSRPCWSGTRGRTVHGALRPPPNDTSAGAPQTVPAPSSVTARYVLPNGVAEFSAGPLSCQLARGSRADAVDTPIARDRNHRSVEGFGEWLRVEECRTAGIAEADPARNPPRGPGVVNDIIQSRSLDPAPTVPLGRRWDFAARTQARESVSHGDDWQSPGCSRLERIDLRQSGGTKSRRTGRVRMTKPRSEMPGSGAWNTS